MPEFTPLEGRCLCERVRFEITAPLIDAEYCHCTRCQRRSASIGTASAGVEPGSFRVTAGEELLRAFRPEGHWHDYFCGECGSLMYCRSPHDPPDVCVSMGAIDGDPGIRPEFHQHVAYAPPWDTLPDDGLPRYEESWRDGQSEV